MRAAIRAGYRKLLTGNVGDGNWNHHRHFFVNQSHWQKLEKQHSKLRKSVWLFNVDADPCNMSDLSESHPEVVKHVLTRKAEYNQTTVMATNSPDDLMAGPELDGGLWGPWLGLDKENRQSWEENDRNEWMIKIKHRK